MRKLRINLTLAGFGPRRQPAPPPTPEAPPAPPSQVSAERATAGQAALQQKQTAKSKKATAKMTAARTTAMPFNVRNVGGASGLSIATTTRALKALTGM